VQESLLKQHCRKDQEAVAVVTATPLTQPAVQEEAAPAATVTKEYAPEEEPDCIFPTDKTNGLNNLSHKGMFWVVRHRWPRLAYFVFNCCHHDIRLIVCKPIRATMILMSGEGSSSPLLAPSLALAEGLSLLPPGTNFFQYEDARKVTRMLKRRTAPKIKL
jgi:hypothetical protein